MSKLIALVEGHTEARFFEVCHPNAIAVRCIPNGDAVPIELIVQEIVDQLDLIGGGDIRVVVWLDREGRTESFHEIRQQIIDQVYARCNGREIYVGVCDRHVENWILADNQTIWDATGDNTYVYPGDGTFGKRHFERIFDAEMHGPTSKAKLLKSCNPGRIASNSGSFSNFRDGLDFEWWWLNK